MNLKTVTLPAVVLKVLADEIAARLTAVKDAAKAGFAETGTNQAIPELPDGTPVATVSLAGGNSKGASVTSPAVLLAWVQENHPGEITHIIRDNYLKKLLDTAKAEGRPVDPATGEVVPGITVKDSTPYVSVRMKPGGKDAIIAAWRAGQLADIDLVAPLAIDPAVPVTVNGHRRAARPPASPASSPADDGGSLFDGDPDWAAGQ